MIKAAINPRTTTATAPSISNVVPSMANEIDAMPPPSRGQLCQSTQSGDATRTAGREQERVHEEPLAVGGDVEGVIWRVREMRFE